MRNYFQPRLIFILLSGLAVAGCGRSWERFWGQDTRPETRYIPYTTNADSVDIAIGPLNPTQWADRRFREARTLSVWACTATNECVSVPRDGTGSEEMAVYVLTEGSLISVYNVAAVYPWATKIKVQMVF